MRKVIFIYAKISAVIEGLEIIYMLGAIYDNRINLAYVDDLVIKINAELILICLINSLLLFFAGIYLLFYKGKLRWWGIASILISITYELIAQIAFAKFE